jgi:hypothetical protein
MIEAYQKYKAWWLEHRAHYYKVGQAGSNHVTTDEDAFEQHLDRMSNYELMETLSNWE